MPSFCVIWTRHTQQFYAIFKMCINTYQHHRSKLHQGGLKSHLFRQPNCRGLFKRIPYIKGGMTSWPFLFFGDFWPWHTYWYEILDVILYTFYIHLYIRFRGRQAQSPVKHESPQQQLTERIFRCRSDGLQDTGNTPPETSSGKDMDDEKRLVIYCI